MRNETTCITQTPHSSVYGFSTLASVGRISLESQGNLTFTACATHVSPRRMGTSTREPIVAASAWSEPTPYVAIVIAMANSCDPYECCHDARETIR